MSGRAALNPWQQGAPLDLSPFPHLLHRPAYTAIHEFLGAEALVQREIARLDQETAGADNAGFQAHLARIEARFGFSATPAVITLRDDLIKASRFWLYLMNRQPIIDYGAGEQDHGVLIHRVQWALVCLWHERTGRLGGPLAFVAELYQNLGGSNARAMTDRTRQRLAAGARLDTGAQGVGAIFLSLWDNLVDGSMPLANATVPEHFRRYIDYRYPALYARMRC